VAPSNRGNLKGTYEGNQIMIKFFLQENNMSAKFEMEKFFSVLKYAVKVLIQMRMTALERRAAVVPVSVPVPILRSYLSDGVLDENHTILVHPEVALSLRLNARAWVYVQSRVDGPLTLSQMVTSSLVRIEHALLSDVLFYNTSQGICDAEQLILSPSLLEKLPKAVSFDVSIQKCPKGWDAADVDALMAEFFSRPRPVALKNIFCISVQEYMPELFFSKLSPDPGSDIAWFRVEELEAQVGQQDDPDRRMCYEVCVLEKVKHYFMEFFQVSKDETRVALVRAKEVGLPGRTDVFTGHIDTFLELEKAVRLYLDPQYFQVLHKGRRENLSLPFNFFDIFKRIFFFKFCYQATFANERVAVERVLINNASYMQ